MLSAYTQICDENRKQTEQTTMNIFLKIVTSPQEDPELGPSDDILESIVITENDRFMCFIAP